MKILVVGATGLLGSEICRRLRARNFDVRALSRPTSRRRAELLAVGLDVVDGDIRSRSTLAALCQDVTVVISTATVMGSADKSLKLRDVDYTAQLMLVEVAKASGVEHFIYISISPTLQPPAPLVRYKRAVERAVRASGMQWTILQPSVFMDVWISPLIGWDFDAGKALVFGSGEAPIAYIGVGDVAEHAVRSIGDPRLHNKDVPLGGPELLSPNEVVRIFEAAFGRKFRVTRVPRPVLALAGNVMRFFNEEEASKAALGAQAATGDVFDTSLQHEIGVPLTTVRDYAQRQRNAQITP